MHLWFWLLQEEETRNAKWKNEEECVEAGIVS